MSKGELNLPLAYYTMAAGPTLGRPTVYMAPRVALASYSTMALGALRLAAHYIPPLSDVLRPRSSECGVVALCVYIISIVPAGLVVINDGR